MPEPSIIPRGVVVNGAIDGEGDLIVLGEVHGPIRMAGGVSVEEGALVRGHVRARSVVVAGVLKGNIYADVSTRLDSTARVVGDLRAPRIRLTKGAQLRGRLFMEALDAPTMATLDLTDWDSAQHTFTGVPAPVPVGASQVFEARAQPADGATIPSAPSQAAMEDIRFQTDAPQATLRAITAGAAEIGLKDAALLATALPAGPQSAAPVATAPTAIAPASDLVLERESGGGAPNTADSTSALSPAIPSLQSTQPRRDTLLAPPPLPTDVSAPTYHGDNAPTIPPPAPRPQGLDDRTLSDSTKTDSTNVSASSSDVTLADSDGPASLSRPLPLVPVLPATLPRFGRLVAIRRKSTP